MAIGAYGVELNKGDFVVYPGRGGSRLWLKHGVITNIIDIDNKRKKIQLSRGKSHITWNATTNKWDVTQVIKQTITIHNIKNLIKVNFEDTQFNDTNHDEYQILTTLITEGKNNEIK